MVKLTKIKCEKKWWKSWASGPGLRVQWVGAGFAHSWPRFKPLHPIWSPKHRARINPWASLGEVLLLKKVVHPPWSVRHQQVSGLINIVESREREEEWGGEKYLKM